MDPAMSELGVLLDAVDEAYRRMRLLVIDRLRPTERVDTVRLNSTQQRAVDAFARAEDQLRQYRSLSYAISLLPDQEHAESRS
jgi:hypothetical protein